MLIFQLLIYPWIVEQIGTTRSQRWSCCISFPVFFAYPFLSRIQDSEGVLMTASLVLLFLTNVAGNAVGTNLHPSRLSSRICMMLDDVSVRC